MVEMHPRYMCFPSVAEAGKETEVIIRPRDISRVFRCDREYELCVIGMRDDMPDYKAPLAKEHPFYIKGGCLHFTHTFEAEQEYSVRFCEKGKKEVRLSMYALRSDLYALRPLKGDFHTHSYYSDGADGLAMTPADYREEGFDFFALTDHNRMYTSEMAAKLYENVPLGMHIMLGEEVHTPGSMLHIVNAGAKKSVCNKYISDPEAYQREVDLIEKGLTHISEQYRRRAAMAKWACDEIHKEGGIAIFAHPFWSSNIYNISEEFCDILFDEKIFDAFEIMGGIGQKHNNLQLALWQEQLAKGNALPIVGSSDSHNHDFTKNIFARRFTVVFARSNTTEDILEAVRGGLCAAGEIPAGNTDEVRFYSKSLRLTMLAHFLYENYFNETRRLCMGEGILMRRYAEGEDAGEVLALLEDTVKDFYERFYGITESGDIPQSRLDFLDECLELQKNVGPKTCGSSLNINVTNIRRE